MMRGWRVVALAIMSLLSVQWAMVSEVQATAVVETVTIPASRDTYVKATSPSKTYGTKPELIVDGDPETWSLLHFTLDAVGPGTVLSVDLRLSSTDRSVDAGRVHATTTAWTEGAAWDRRPSIGPAAASLGRVESGADVAVSLPIDMVAANELGLAIVPTSTDGARFSSRESGVAPVLVVRVEQGETPPPDPDPDPDAGTYGTSVVATRQEGSSDPTQLASNQHVAVTSGGRTLVAHGIHSQGVQLAWKDTGATTWSRLSTGDASGGRLLPGSSTGDWATSIVVGRSADGHEHAWVVMGRDRYSSGYQIFFRRLDDLDAPSGPSVGPLVALTPSGRPTKRPDVAIASRPDGTPVVAVLWTQKDSSSRSSVRTAWIDPSTSTPLQPVSRELITGTNHEQHGSFVAGPLGLRIVAEDALDEVRLHSHALADLDAPWVASSAHVPGGPGITAVNGVEVDDGVLVSLQADPSGASVVHRFSASGSTGAIDGAFEGVSMPFLSGGSSDAWLLAVRVADGAVVARHRTAAGWGAEVVLMTSADTGAYGQWPSAPRRTGDRLRVLARGAMGSSVNRSAVLFSLTPV